MVTQPDYSKHSDSFELKYNDFDKNNIKPFDEFVGGLKDLIEVRNDSTGNEHKEQVRSSLDSITRKMNEYSGDIKRSGLSFKDAIDLMDNDKLQAYINEGNNAAKNKEPAPYAKLYLGYNEGKEGYPYGVNAFIIPPTTYSPAHTHKGASEDDVCISWVTGGQFEEVLYSCKGDKPQYAFETESRLRNPVNESSITTRLYTAEDKLKGDDAHQLVNKSGGIESLKEFTGALQLYKDSGRKDIASIEKAESLSGYSIHTYIGVDEKKNPSASDLMLEERSESDKNGYREKIRKEAEGKEITKTDSYAEFTTMLSQQRAL